MFFHILSNTCRFWVNLNFFVRFSHPPPQFMICRKFSNPSKLGSSGTPSRWCWILSSNCPIIWMTIRWWMRLTTLWQLMQRTERRRIRSHQRLETRWLSRFQTRWGVSMRWMMVIQSPTRRSWPNWRILLEQFAESWLQQLLKRSMDTESQQTITDSNPIYHKTYRLPIQTR